MRRRLGQCLFAVLLAATIRLVLLPIPIKLWAFGADGWTPPTQQLEARQVVRTEYYRGFFRPTRTFSQARSRAILQVLQDSLNFGGDTTPNFSQRLVYFDAQGRALGYTDLDVFDDAWLVARMEPGSFRRGSIMTGSARQQLLQLLGFTPPFTKANLRQQL